MDMLDRVKLALRLTKDVYNEEIAELIAAAQLDLGVAGVIVPAEFDALVTRAIITYCRMMFYRELELKASYDEQKAQLSTCTGYTDWLTA